MTARATGVGLMGIDGVLVEVQVDRQEGLPGIDITGLPAASIREARYRVRSAFRTCNYEWPRERLVVNLAPADVPKAGTAYDLPLAIALLSLGDQLPPGAVTDAVFHGELGLDGSICPVPGSISAALAARAAGRKRFFTSVTAAEVAAAVPDLQVYGVSHLVHLVEFLHGRFELSPSTAGAEPTSETGSGTAIDMNVIRGQHRARRAMEVAAAGGHNLLFVGPPGCGKTLLARALPGILPPMTVSERLEVSQVHGLFGAGGRGPLVSARPFRAPHATASYAALVGGGNPPQPGEVSLAHRGVLFLDETPEFSRAALEALRAPLEDRFVTIARSGRHVRFPASFSLVCAMNPCPCGHRGQSTRPCRCTPLQVDRYRRRISGPLLDRVDMHVALRPVDARLLVGEHAVESSAEIRARVTAARERQIARNRREDGGVANAELRPADLERYAPLEEEEIRHLLGASSALGLTARSWHRVIRVARTIADLAGDERIGRAALSEALTYRILDRDQGSRPRVGVSLQGTDGRAPEGEEQATRAEARGGA